MTKFVKGARLIHNILRLLVSLRERKLARMQADRNVIYLRDAIENKDVPLSSSDDCSDDHAGYLAHLNNTIKSPEQALTEREVILLQGIVEHKWSIEPVLAAWQKSHSSPAMLLPPLKKTANPTSPNEFKVTRHDITDDFATLRDLDGLLRTQRAPKNESTRDMQI